MSNDPLLKIIQVRDCPYVLRDLMLAIYDLDDSTVEHQRVKAAARLYVLRTYPSWAGTHAGP